MTTTTNYQLTMLEVGQKEKEVTINTNFTLLDVVPKWLGRLSGDPATSGVPLGSSYFNTSTNKLRVLTQLTPSVIWANAA